MDVTRTSAAEVDVTDQITYIKGIYKDSSKL